MSNNKLMEAAADILASSKGKNGAPMEKMQGTEVEDLGGPTPQNSKPDDDSAKIHAGKGAKSAVAPTTNASNASAKMEEVESIDEKKTLNDLLRKKLDIKPTLGYLLRKRLKKNEEIENYSLEELKEFMVSEEFEQLDELSKNTLRSYLKGSRAENQGSLGSAGHMSDKARSLGRTDDDKDDARYQGAKSAKKRLNAMKEDIDALFADDSTISEEFKSKVSTIFEARVEDRVTQIEEEIETRYAGMLEEAVESVKADLTEKVDDYLSYVVEQWMEENEIAIETGLRAELTEDFIGGLRNLFAEHYIDVPAEKVDLVDELAGKVEELESKLNEEIERGVSYAKALVESRKNEIAREVTEGLPATQAEKIKSLAESVEFSTEDEYKSKLDTIRENYFPSGAKKATESQLNEQFEETEEKKVIHDPFVAAVSQAISKTKF